MIIFILMCKYSLDQLIYSNKTVNNIQVSIIQFTNEADTAMQLTDTYNNKTHFLLLHDSYNILNKSSGMHIVVL